MVGTRLPRWRPLTPVFRARPRRCRYQSCFCRNFCASLSFWCDAWSCCPGSEPRSTSYWIWKIFFSGQSKSLNGVIRWMVYKGEKVRLHFALALKNYHVFRSIVRSYSGWFKKSYFKFILRNFFLLSMTPDWCHNMSCQHCQNMNT